MNLFDSPGLNDPDGKRTDEETFTNICISIQEEAFKQKPNGDQYGLSGCLQCIMVPKSGRIKKTSIEIMSKMMQTFTLSYQESKHIGPAFYVIFTDFSKFEKE